ncbi:MAG: DUF1735 domain-containing protein [Pedobacter sp.]|jgi:hypothetical protein|uniref:DUF1735 domain-containing protein n=1 Tax=Pedobacter sp. TaxID=1411316 RepID=UPI003568E0B5
MKKVFNKSIALLFLVVSLTSCLKDDTMVLDPEKSAGNVVEFGNTGTPSSPSGAPVFAYTPTTLDPTVATAKFTTSVRYAGAEDVAPQDITVTLAAAPEAVTKWNAAYPTAQFPYVQMNATTYSFPSTVTIKKGEKFASFDVTIKTNLLNQSQSNVLGIKINSTSAAIISGNFGTVIYNLPIKSIWEGSYVYSVDNNYGQIDANIGQYTEAGIKLSTVGPNRVRVQYIAQTYSGFVEYQFNGDNTAITEVKPYNGATNYANSIQSFTLNTATKSFNIDWTFANRGLRESWVRQ